MASTSVISMQHVHDRDHDQEAARGGEVEATLTVEHDGLTATSAITTEGDEAATCVPTLPLT